MYLLFAGATYYPQGGFEDLVGKFDSTEEIKAFVEADQGDDYQWAQIVDEVSLNIVLLGDVIEPYMYDYKGYEWHLPEDEKHR